MEHIKMKIFETFKCSGQNLSNSPNQFSNLQKDHAIFDNFHQNYFFGFAYYC